MLHLGDITKISGYDVPAVNVIIGGSPCQDLSIAGNRKGLSGERSGLFMEQVRIIKEMRDYDRRNGRTDNNVRPRFMVWENVPGAFSSNKGEDFRTVLEETAKIADKNAVIPRPPKGKWTTSGCIMGDRWSVAWRVFDAQFWGVPQRRRRIALVADFGGQCAPEILFEHKGVSGYPPQSGTPRKRIAGNAESRAYSPIGNTVYCIQANSIDRADTAGCNGKGWTEDISYTLNTADRHVVVFENRRRDARYKGPVDVSQTVMANFGTGGNNTPLVVQNGSVIFSQAAYDKFIPDDKSAALKNSGENYGGGSETLIVFSGQSSHTAGISASETISPSLMNTKQVNVLINSVVRRLTPLECERLQGFPDSWTDIGEWTDGKGKVHKTSDAARYKALGNSIALPNWFYVLDKLNRYCEDKTMASLFDGIGGFPLIWETLNGKGSCLWSSEIEEFPIAVTKNHFGDE